MGRRSGRGKRAVKQTTYKPLEYIKAQVRAAQRFGQPVKQEVVTIVFENSRKS